MTPPITPCAYVDGEYLLVELDGVPVCFPSCGSVVVGVPIGFNVYPSDLKVKVMKHLLMYGAVDGCPYYPLCTDAPLLPSPRLSTTTYIFVHIFNTNRHSSNPSAYMSLHYHNKIFTLGMHTPSQINVYPPIPITATDADVICEMMVKACFRA